MPERPLLILPSPAALERRNPRGGGGGSTHLPARDRQDNRLSPKFSVLQQTLEARRARLQVEASGLLPEEVIVLETVGSVQDFIVAVRNVPGLEWLGEIEDRDIPPDEDFFEITSQGTPRGDRELRGRLLLVLTNQQALRQLLSLWDTWKQGQTLPQGLRRWGDLFSRLYDVRTWGVRERLQETGILEDWRERVAHNQEVVPCEIELWFKPDARRRQIARDRVAGLVQTLGGQILREATVEEIAYHALLVQLPVSSIQRLFEDSQEDISLIQCEQIQFFRATGQMAAIVAGSDRSTDDTPIEEPPTQLGEPIIALFDGLPLQNHRRLQGRLIVDDPDGFESEYPANDRNHGTAMASLIVNGDLNANETASDRLLYARPILRPDSRFWMQPRPETVPEDTLVVDLMHRAVRRLFEGDGTEPPVAPQVCVINLSIGIRDRLFDSALTPLARMLDWLAWKYRVLFVVSAGNHLGPIELRIPRTQLSVLTPEELQSQIVQAVAADARNRRLLSPAEAINALTVGAVSHDHSPPVNLTGFRECFVDGNLPSPINAQGMGYRRSIKPDLLLSGGRISVRETVGTSINAILETYRLSAPPGQKVAAPGPTVGDLAFTWHTRGTSNAAALMSRAAAKIYDALNELLSEPGAEVLDRVPRAVWLKALLVHSSSWSRAYPTLDQVLRTIGNTAQFKETLTRLLGYGIADVDRVRECTPNRVTGIGGGLLQAEAAYIHRLPLPPSLSGQRGLRRLIITLAWLTPVNPMHHAWRRAQLWFRPEPDLLQVRRREADWQAVQRGTVQHEVLEGDRACAFCRW